MKQYLRNLATAAFGSRRQKELRLMQDFQTALIRKTDNFGEVRWLGAPVWQDVSSLWTMQETIFDTAPELIIECGTNRGGSAFFYATLFDLMQKGRVVTIDVEKLHDLSHARVDWIIGDSTSPAIVEQVEALAKDIDGPILVVLDSDHTKKHVLNELNTYARFVTRGSYVIVQDGVIDTLPIFKGDRPGPLEAVKEFLKGNQDFEIDKARSERFLITHHPCGWLKRVN